MAQQHTNTMASSDFNLQKLQTKELAEHLAASIAIGGNVAIFGRRGTGKTEISKQEIKKANLKEVYLNLSVLERVDMGGYPDIMGSSATEAKTKELKRRFVDFLLPQFYENMIDGDRGVVALLDEVDKADPSLWAPLLEFTQFRSINGRELRNLQAIIMTGNLISEGGARPSLPLLDRAEKYLVEADATSWLDWAGRSHIHPSITAYIYDNPKDLFGAVDPEDRYSDPSPRGWARASDILHKGEEKGWQPSLLNRKVCGCVGKDAGIKYSNYYEHYQQLLPMIEEIYHGKEVTNKFNALEPTRKIVLCMITCARLATQLDYAYENYLKTGEKPECLSAVGRFLQKVPSENALVGIRTQVQIDRLIKYNLDEDADWSDLLTKVHKQVER